MFHCKEVLADSESCSPAAIALQGQGFPGNPTAEAKKAVHPPSRLRQVAQDHQHPASSAGMGRPNLVALSLRRPNAKSMARFPQNEAQPQQTRPSKPASELLEVVTKTQLIVQRCK